MKKLLAACLVAALAGYPLLDAGAQRGDGKNKPLAGEVPPLKLTLGALAQDGAVSRTELDAAGKAGLVVRDAKGSGGVVESFSFTFAERVMYEDSLGNPLPTTDYLIEYYQGNKVPEDVAAELRMRLKPGDTLYFERIKVRLPDGTPRKGENLKFWITR